MPSQIISNVGYTEFPRPSQQASHCSSSACLTCNRNKVGQIEKLCDTLSAGASPANWIITGRGGLKLRELGQAYPSITRKPKSNCRESRYNKSETKECYFIAAVYSFQALPTPTCRFAELATPQNSWRACKCTIFKRDACATRLLRLRCTTWAHQDLTFMIA